MAKTNIEDIDRNIYDIKNKDNYEFKMQKGLNKEIVEEISKKKNEPEWMRDIRLKALETYNQWISGNRNFSFGFQGQEISLCLKEWKP